MLATASAASGGGNFLIPNGTILVEFVIFVIVLGAMAKFVLPSMQKVMDERAERIRADQAASDAGGSEAAALDAEGSALLDAARVEARTLLAEAAEQVAALLARAREEGQAEFERRAVELRTRGAAERTRVEDELSRRLSDLVAEAAGRVLGENIDAAANAALLSSALEAAIAAERP